MELMLQALFDSAPARTGWRRVIPWVSGTTVAHVAIVLALLTWAVSQEVGADAAPADAPEVTYLEVAAVEPEPELAPEEPEPPPEPEFVPEPPPEPLPDELPAGFQELEVPPEIVGIPDEIAVDSVRAADFSGRGVVGGVADGVIGMGPVAKSASELRPATQKRPSVVDDAFVTEPPVLLDVERVSAQMAALYPRVLRDMAVGGTVIVKFMVLEDGRVEPSSIEIIEAAHPLLGEATRRAVRSLRFRPGRMLWEGELHPVRVRTIMPLNWTLH